MALVIVTGGTTGGVNGSAVSQNGTRSAPLTFPGLDSEVTTHMRGADGGGAQTSTNVTLSLPDGVAVNFPSVSATAWYTGDLTATQTPVIYGVNQPVKFKQTAAATTATSSFVSDGTWSTYAMGQVGTVTPSASSGQVALSWAHVPPALTYRVKWGTSSPPTNVVTATATSGTNTYTKTGLTNGTLYYFTVEAFDGTNYGTASAEVSATPAVSAVVDEDFTAEGYTLDTTKFGTAIANGGSVAVENGVGVVIDTQSPDTKAGLLYYKTKLSSSTTGTYEWYFKVADAVADYTTAFFMWQQTTAPTCQPQSNGGSVLTIQPDIYAHITRSIGAYLNASSINSSAFDVTDAYITLDAPMCIRYEVDSAHARWRLTLLKGDGTTLAASSWILFSATRAVSGDLWTLIGDAWTDAGANCYRTIVTRFRHLATIGS